MGWIIMQPDNYKESHQVEQPIIKNEECTSYPTKNGARLQPICLGYIAWTETEKVFHSFNGKVASGRWGIRQNRK